MRSTIVSGVVALVFAMPMAVPAQAQGSDSAAVAATVARFHNAVQAGDSTAVRGLLADDALILESGDIETRQEYRSHHLPGDIAFLKAVRSEPGKLRVRVEGDAAWAASTSAMKGEYRGKAVDIASAELMGLTRAPAGWRIRAIHWSSRPRGPAK
jgi:ketosteroid isomerase-like protein